MRISKNKHLDYSGFCILRGVLTSEVVASLRLALEPIFNSDISAGTRGLLRRSAEVKALSESRVVLDLIEAELGQGSKLVRSILFNKNQDTNWKVPWHQDLSIAVNKKSEVEGYGPWSIKEGIVHVQPPVEILESMLTIRLHLDPSDETNGALSVVPGSHRLGRVAANEAAAIAEKMGSVLCATKSGDAILMRPLILHSSKKTISSKPRRVIHLEYANTSLSESLEWAEDV